LDSGGWKRRRRGPSFRFKGKKSAPSNVLGEKKNLGGLTCLGKRREGKEPEPPDFIKPNRPGV